MVLFTGVGKGLILIYFDVDQEQLKKMSLLQILDGWILNMFLYIFQRVRLMVLLTTNLMSMRWDRAFLSWVIYMFFNLSL